MHVANASSHIKHEEKSLLISAHRAVHASKQNFITVHVQKTLHTRGLCADVKRFLPDVSAGYKFFSSIIIYPTGEAGKSYE